MKKKLHPILKIILILLLIPIIIIAFLALPWTLLVIYGTLYDLLVPYPNEPTITYGEFPFEIVYKVDGEIFEVSDVLVCEYEGSYKSAEIGRGREWNSYLKSDSDTNHVIIKPMKKNAVCCYLGEAAYYMNDVEETDTQGEPIPELLLKTWGNGSDYLTEEEALNKYGVEIVSWELSEPIENKFVPWFFIDF